MEKETQCVVIGASAAGISAAIYLKRRGIDFILISKDIGGEVALSGEVENYLGFPKITGLELAKKFEEHLKYYEISPLLYYYVNNIREEGKQFLVEAINEANTKILIKTKSIIIATGSKPKKLNVSGEDKFYQKGLSYCTVCDGPLFRNKVVAVIGGGNSALESALMLGDLCPKVYLLTKNNEMKGDAILIKNLQQKKNIQLITNALTQEIFGDNFVRGLKYLDLKTNEIKTLDVEGIFVHIGLTPNTNFVPDDFKIKNSYGEIVVNKLCETAKAGIFAAGDITDIPFKQISIAVGQGTIAALSCVNYLNREIA